MTRPPRRPVAFRLDDVSFAGEPPPPTPPPPPPPEGAAPEPEAPRGRPPRVRRRAVVIAEPDHFAPPDGDAVIAVATRKPRRWLPLLLSAAGGLIVLALGLAVDSLIRDLFNRTGSFGWVGVVLTVLLLVAVVVIAIRELLSLFRLRRIGDLRRQADEAARMDGRDAAYAACRELIGLYQGRSETAAARSRLAGHLREIIDGRDMIGLAETELMLPLDVAARRLVLDSAKRVSIVTAISPRAVVDVAFVLMEIFRLIRRLGVLYGGRPGALGFWRLTRKVFGHLAITGGMAAGDSLVQQIVGHGIAARLSARLGEGVINGLLTARVGIAAIDVCRPMPFIVGRPPRVGDVMAEITRGVRGKGEKGPEETE